MATGAKRWGEVDVAVDLVRRLLDSQHAQWSGLPLIRVRSEGTDNAMFRLGDELVVRLPMHEGPVHAVAKEQRWLPVLAPHLPLEIPEPVAIGEPGDGYPYPWSVYRWIEGRTLDVEQLDQIQAAHDLAVFVRALQGIDATGGPTPQERGGDRREGHRRGPRRRQHLTATLRRAPRSTHHLRSRPSAPTPGGTMDQQEISDRLEIGDLLARYARAVDTKDWTLWRSLFTDDAHLDYRSAGGPVGGREDVGTWLEEALATFPMTQHLITNVEVVVDGDTAHAHALFFNPMTFPGHDEPSSCGGTYDHDLVRTPDGWRSQKLLEQNAWFLNAPKGIGVQQT